MLRRYSARDRLLLWPTGQLCVGKDRAQRMSRARMKVVTSRQSSARK
jgi:hypothetical protein